MVFECVCLWDAAKWNSAYRESDTRFKWIEENKGLFSPLIPLILPTVVTLFIYLFAIFFFVHLSFNSTSRKTPKIEHINTNTYSYDKKSQIMSDIFYLLSVSAGCDSDAALTVKQWPPEDDYKTAACCKLIFWDIQGIKRIIPRISMQNV